MERLLEPVNLHLCDITRCQPQWHVVSVRDPYYRLYWVHDGHVTYMDDVRHMRLLPGTLYLLPAYTVYEVVHKPDAPLECLWFHFTLNRVLPLPLLAFKPDPGDVPHHLLHTLEAMMREDAPRQLVTDALGILLQYLCGDSLLDVPGDERLEPILWHIRAHFAEPLPNERLAALAGFNTRYFIRLFRQIYGKTPQEYLADYRCFQAESHLLQGLQVKEIARMTGFADAKAFSRFFRKKRGISPTDYKQRLVP